MKSSLYRLAACGALALAVTTPSIGLAQEPPKPTKQHEELKAEVGVWDAEVTMWMSADGEPMKSKAVETNEMSGPFWLMSKFEGDFGGMKFQGHSMMGYSPAKKKFVGAWNDTVSPYLMTMEGEYDEAQHTLTMLGEGHNWATDELEKTKMVTVYEGKDAKTFTMYMAKPEAEGGWFKHMEVKYKRRK